ncbi:hypothetical protein EJ357_10855 [Streptomyces cyaneochromogenes]|uniref:Pectinesterase catalytic domain-containing protein n=1 Tax=Streptomyces cyaneochromogenes TaxID=2496836 RepID=A0A3S9M3Z1_9ACTN|nr:hypothetical protein EJ357_10855 [Streptomyces cyaneochromogenes]
MALVTRFSGPQKRIGDSVTLHGPGEYSTVQAAVDAVPDGNAGRVTIAVAPGTYREKVVIPAGKPHIVLEGTGRDGSDTVTVFDTPAAYEGSTGSATVRIAAHDVTAREAAHELNGEQAPGQGQRRGALPWTDMSGFSWKDARFAEYRNYGQGAAVTADRPQMGDDEPRTHTVADHLKGADGWKP